LDEVCEEAGYESNEGLGEPPPKVWRLDQASAHRTSHNGLEIDAMWCTSKVRVGQGGLIPAPTSSISPRTLAAPQPQALLSRPSPVTGRVSRVAKHPSSEALKTPSRAESGDAR
jgi:hypothetical protein